MKYAFPKGSTSVIVPVFIQDSSSTTGAGLGSLDQTSGIVGGYVRPGGLGVALAVDENVTTEGTYQAPSVVGKVRIGTPANMRPGTYELHFHNDLFAAGNDAVFITFGGATNMADLIIEIQLTDVDLNDGVRGGMTALPNAVADANNGLVTGDGSVTFTAGVGNRPAVDVEAASNAGYERGAVWVDTNASNTNTVVGIDGTATNPVSTMAAANTLAAALGTNILYLVAGSSIALVQAHNFWTFIAYGATIALGGQSINGAVFFGAKINGNDDGSNTNRVRYIDCDVDGSTLGQFIMCRCRLTAGTLTLAETGTYFMDACYSGVAGTGTPALDFGAGLNASNVNVRHYSGGIEIENMGAGTGSYNMSLEGHGQLVINANCSATSTVAIRGNFTVTDNAGGAVTLSDDARITRSEIADDVHDEATAGHTGAGTFGLQLKTVVDTISAAAAAIQAITDNLPDSGALTTIGTDTARLTAARAGALTDWINGGRLDLLLDAIKVVTDAITTTGAGLTGLGGMSAAMKAEVKSEVNGAIDTAIPELGVATPATTPTIRTSLMLMYMALLNKLIVQTSGTDALEIHNSAGTKIASKLVTDAAGDYTEAKMT